MTRVGCLLAAVGVLAFIGVPSASGLRAERIGAAGVSVALPEGWHAIRQSDYRSQNDPVTRIVASSGPIAFGRGCNDLDYRFPSTAVAIVVVEWVRLKQGRLPPRPRSFTAKNLPVRPPPALECFSGPGGGVQFSERGRRFAAYILLGKRAPSSLARSARVVLNTLRVRRS